MIKGLVGATSIALFVFGLINGIHFLQYPLEIKAWTAFVVLAAHFAFFLILAGLGIFGRFGHTPERRRTVLGVSLLWLAVTSVIGYMQYWWLFTVSADTIFWLTAVVIAGLLLTDMLITGASLFA